MDSTLSEQKIVPGQLMLLEIQKKDGSWPRSNQQGSKKTLMSRVTSFFNKDKEKPPARPKKTATYQKGVCGLANIGA